MGGEKQAIGGIVLMVAIVAGFYSAVGAAPVTDAGVGRFGGAVTIAFILLLAFGGKELLESVFS